MEVPSFFCLCLPTSPAADTFQLFLILQEKTFGLELQCLLILAELLLPERRAVQNHYLAFQDQSHRFGQMRQLQFGHMPFQQWAASRDVPTVQDSVLYFSDTLQLLSKKDILPDPLLQSLAHSLCPCSP